MIVSVWHVDRPSVSPPAELLTAFDFESSPEIEAPKIDVLRLGVSLPCEQTEAARIMRIFHGQTRPGKLDGYVEEARGGTLADVAARQGPAALYLGIERPDRFVTVSVWTAWENVEAATGVNLRRPVATRHAERLVSSNPVHYEIVPHTMAVISPAAASGR